MTKKQYIFLKINFIKNTKNKIRDLIHSNLLICFVMIYTEQPLFLITSWYKIVSFLDEPFLLLQKPLKNLSKISISTCLLGLKHQHQISKYLIYSISCSHANESFKTLRNSTIEQKLSGQYFF